MGKYGKYLKHYKPIWEREAEFKGKEADITFTFSVSIFSTRQALILLAIS